MTNGELFSGGKTTRLKKLKFLIITNSKKKEMEKLKNIHPGEVLMEEFLIPMKISAYRLSKDLEIPQTRISQIIKAKRRITADTALRLSSYFGNSAKFWLGLQDDYDIEEERKTQTMVFEKIKRIRSGYASQTAV
jgi:antitoxin HigA-1